MNEQNHRLQNQGCLSESFDDVHSNRQAMNSIQRNTTWKNGVIHMKPDITSPARTILALAVICAFVGCADGDHRPAAGFDGNNASKSKSFHTVSPEAFATPPMEARPGAYWCWLNGTVDHDQMTREMEEAKELGMRGFEIWDVGVYRPVNMVPAGPAFLGEESLKSIKYAMPCFPCPAIMKPTIMTSLFWRFLSPVTKNSPHLTSG